MKRKKRKQLLMDITMLEAAALNLLEELDHIREDMRLLCDSTVEAETITAQGIGGEGGE